MKFAIVLLAVLSVALASTLNRRHPFYEFKVQHNKVYKDAAEEALRFKFFAENLEKINKHNALYEAGKKTYKMGINQFADWSAEEFKQYLALSGPVPDTFNSSAKVYQPPVGVEAPASVDWRSKGAVNPVKNQEQCGSCWAFSTVGSLEGVNFLATGRLQSFSEQNLVDCSGDYGNQGCGGGWMDWAYQYIADNGLETESDYPYTAQDGYCQFSQSRSAITVSGHVMIQTGSESDLQSAVASVGPVAIAVDASQWQFYSGGIYSQDDFYGLDHGVVAVGYGAEGGQDYWIVRNSWGPSWGEAGYIRVARNAGNQLGITNRACYPTL